jgi:hypothetical protein
MLALLFLFVFVLYDIRKVQGNEVRMELNGTCQLLVCSDDYNLLSENLNITQKHDEMGERSFIIPVFYSLLLYSLLLGLGRFSVSEPYIQPVGLLARGISPSQALYLHTE